jgi:hypothetical protein
MIKIAITQAVFDAIAATAARLGRLRGGDQREGRAADLARAPRGEPAAGDARPERELQRCHSEAGCNWRATVRVIAWLVSVTRLRRPALAETLTCSTWQGIRTCTDAPERQGMTLGNEGNCWTTSRWQGHRDDGRPGGVGPDSALSGRQH